MKLFKKITLGLLVLVGLLIVFNLNKIQRLYKVINFFEKEQIVENFRNMDDFFPVTRLAPSSNPYKIPKKEPIPLPNSFIYQGENINTEEFLTEYEVEGLLVVHKDSIVHEDYRKGLQPNDTHIAWSVSKSIVAALLGIEYDKGSFKLHEPITKYLPQFKGTGYDNVAIKDILQMSSGVGFNEDYADFNSDINRSLAPLPWVALLKPLRKP